MSEDVFGEALALIKRTGIRVADGDLDRMLLVLPNRTPLFVMPRTQTASPSPSRIAADVRRAGRRRVLYLLPRLGRALRTAAVSGEVDAVSTEIERVIIRGRDYVTASGPAPAEAQSGRTAWGRWALERVLILATDPMSQMDLASAVGISQQAVSKILRQHPSVWRGSAGWQAEPALLLESLLQEYPGAGGVATHWYHLDPVPQQIRLLAELAEELAITVQTTGDMAADRYAPRRLPTYAAAYSAEAIDLTVAGFVLTDSDQSTLRLQIPRDKTIHPVGKWYRTSRKEPTDAFVDPVLALWDVLHGSGSDSADAAQMLRAAIVNGTLRA
ncbi:hypothetical protein CLV47_101455 [Antricoccus suffuscus]|uniref:Uncharacterized protein n=1 Tax=Antricoccus suffuscus TaxID=1629062 RepID=A0A2T1A6V0_9ACTN|nr:hypothetical protein [Antricoccus suffuscus]PRZ44329.1 hypothetical protein CLV47_101455 [Antricoccus suffuscus]